MTNFLIRMAIEDSVHRRVVTAESNGEAWEMADAWLDQLDDAEIIEVIELEDDAP